VSQSTLTKFAANAVFNLGFRAFFAGAGLHKELLKSKRLDSRLTILKLTEPREPFAVTALL
jgi:hypothetical protein